MAGSKGGCIKAPHNLTAGAFVQGVAELAQPSGCAEVTAEGQTRVCASVRMQACACAVAGACKRAHNASALIVHLSRSSCSC